MNTAATAPIPTEVFQEFRNMIRQKAWYYARAYQRDFSELESVGHEIFCEAWRSFDASQGTSFSTHLGWQLMRIGDECRTEQNWRTRSGYNHRTKSRAAIEDEEGEMDTDAIFNSQITLPGAELADLRAERRKPAFQDALQRLRSSDAQVLLRAILDGRLTRDDRKTWSQPRLPYAREVFSTWGRARVDAAWYEIQAWWRSYYKTIRTEGEDLV